MAAALILVDLQVDFLGSKGDRLALIDSHPFKDILLALLCEYCKQCLNKL